MTQQALFFISLAAYCIEMLLFVRIKFVSGPLKREDCEDPDLMQWIFIFQLLTPLHFGAYSLVYLIGLWIAKFIPFLFSVIITLQLISLVMNLSILNKLRKCLK